MHPLRFIARPCLVSFAFINSLITMLPACLLLYRHNQGGLREVDLPVDRRVDPLQEVHRLLLLEQALLLVSEPNY